MSDGIFNSAYGKICNFIADSSVDDTEQEIMDDALHIVDSYINFLEQWIVESSEGQLEVEDLLECFEEEFCDA